MTQSQIHYFITVAQDGSITRAANRLFVSQPAISKSISALEKELGFSLFSRQESALILTYAGNRLYNFFIRTKDQYDQLLPDIERHLSSTSTQIRIGCPSSWNPNVFYSRIKDYFAVCHPTVELAVECFTMDEMIFRLKKKQLDLVLGLGFHNAEQLGVESRPLARCNCGILYAKGVLGEAMSIRDFRDIPFIGFGTTYQDYFEALITSICQNEFTPMFRRCANYATAMFELSCGNGIMLFNDWESAVCSTLYGFFPVNASMTVTVMHLASHPNPLVASFAGELSGLFQAAREDGDTHKNKFTARG